MNFIIDCQIYPFHIMVHFGNKKGLIMNLAVSIILCK